MKYISTRGQAPVIDFRQAVLMGLAPDGGLYVPESYPQFTHEQIAGFAGKPYAEIAAEVISAFAGDSLDKNLILSLCREAYSSFDHAAVAPVSQLDDNLFQVELHRGPTLAFKDVAMQLLGLLYDHILASQSETTTIICATSGDTGGAAVEAFRGRKSVRIVVLFPDGRISEVQRRFMTTAEDSNVLCAAVSGDFDDCQAMVKACFNDEQFRRGVNLSGVNSINWARIAAQSVYYFTSAVALGAPHRKVAFAVPTGNFGDAFAGWVAHRMGLPIERIIVATNQNDIVARALQTGRYARGQSAETQSPAMDIQVASNFERLYFESVGRNATETARAFGAFSSTGLIDLPPSAHGMMQGLFEGIAVDEAETGRQMLSTLRLSGSLIDPHTAVGVAAARRSDLYGGVVPVAVLSTAHAAKFPEAVEAATGQAPVVPRRAEGLWSKPERIVQLPADLAAVQDRVRSFARGEAG